jgi:hypothetical protein
VPPPFAERLLTEVAAERLPPRRERCNRRVVKRKMSNYKLKRPEHANPPKPRPIADALRLLSRFY